MSKRETKKKVEIVCLGNGVAKLRQILFSDISLIKKIKNTLIRNKLSKAGDQQFICFLKKCIKNSSFYKLYSQTTHL